MDLSHKNLRVKLWYCLDLMMRFRVVRPPVILSGFWRSGTTWVQQVFIESISAKSQFEPLDPSALFPLHEGYDSDPTQAGYLPLNADVFSQDDLHYLDSAFKGITPRRSGFNYLIRTSIKECFASRVVIKFVRAQFIIPFLVERYKPQGVVHISRHPMAVIQSLLSAKWQWNFSEICLSDLYWREIGIDHCSLVEEIKQYDNAREEEKIAALWAITEREIRKTSGVIYIKYEDLLKDPNEGFAQLFKDMGLSYSGSVDYSKDSPVTEGNRMGASLEDRLNSWRYQMPVKTQDRVRNVLINVWPEVVQEWSLV